MTILKKQFSFIFVIFFFNISLYGQGTQNAYQFSVDLNKVVDDKLYVSLITPPIEKDEITYFIPKVVPGTYSISDFGRFIYEFTAKDKAGEKLKVEEIGKNGWKISDAKNLAEISYWVEDTWDTDKDNVIFEPSGTSFEEGKVFLVNTHGFFGYFEGMTTTPYQLTFNHPENFYGSTPLVPIEKTSNSETYNVESYMRLADSPIMFNEPDTAILKVGGADILVSIYSPNKKVSAKEIAKNIDDVLHAQKEYLGGKLPIEKYAFIIYLMDKGSLSGMMGALEHSYSSVYALPEVSPSYLAQTVKDIAAHEFFHILTPLSIHSEEIHDFDYINPKMSKHLWLYEGVTEYFASHVQVRHELIDIDTYLGEIKGKIQEAEKFKQDLAFTEMSANCLDKYKDEYGNVYEKGALIGLCLDIRLRKLSHGKYGLRDMMADLAKEYGTEKAFKDDELFDKITEIVGFPEIRDFFATYVEGSTPLPLKETFEMVGIQYFENKQTRGISLGNFAIGVNDDQQLYISDVSEMNEFGKKMKYKKDDIIFSVNGEEITLDTAREIFRKSQENAAVDVLFEMEVLRGKKAKKKRLKAKMFEIETEESHVFEASEEPSFEQAATLRSWLSPQ